MSGEDKVSFAGCGPAAWPGAEGVCERQGRDGRRARPSLAVGSPTEPPTPTLQTREGVSVGKPFLLELAEGFLPRRCSRPFGSTASDCGRPSAILARTQASLQPHSAHPEAHQSPTHSALPSIPPAAPPPQSPPGQRPGHLLSGRCPASTTDSLLPPGASSRPSPWPLAPGCEGGTAGCSAGPSGVSDTPVSPGHTFNAQTLTKTDEPKTGFK